MSKSYDFWLEQQLEPDRTRQLYHEGSVCHYSANREDIARQKWIAAQDQQREEEYQRSMRNRYGRDWNGIH